MYDKAAWGADFRRRMAEYDSSHGIARTDAAPLRPAAEPSPSDVYGIEQSARSEWERNASIRLEFGQLERYVAFRKADAKVWSKSLAAAGTHDGAFQFRCRQARHR